MSDTIFAQATANGRAGVAVIRISGPRALTAARSLAGSLPEPRAAALRWLSDPETGEHIDQALVLCFPGPSSFTGEDVAELQIHGGVSISRALIQTLSRIDGLRHAEPGEFTRRALLNARLDLAQVEGLGDLLNAETAAQRQMALRLMAGALSQKAAFWREMLIASLALVEASIDFADEDLPADLLLGAEKNVSKILDELKLELKGTRAAERLREGFEVAFVGAPNVGKSTLLNALAGREAAITSATAGTTRDILEVRMEVDGLPVTFLDMAGLRETRDSVESVGVARARGRAESADLRIFLVSDEQEVKALGVQVEEGDLVVLAKSDLRPRSGAFSVSGATGDGVTDLLDRVALVLKDRVSSAGLASHARQASAIAAAVPALEAALTEIRKPTIYAELVSSEIHHALRALDFLIGKVDVEAVLGSIFQSFCLGK